LCWSRACRGELIIPTLKVAAQKAFPAPHHVEAHS
jgi:hypothetical protein